MLRVLDIEVTDEDIRLGTPRNALTCPLARAIRRTTAGGAYNYVRCTGRSITIEGKRYATPLEMASFMDHFDQSDRAGYSTPKAQTFKLLLLRKPNNAR